MVTDSVAPRPSAKMLGHIQHPSIPAVCVCVCAHMCVCMCSCVCVKCSGPPGEWEPPTAKKVSHHTSFAWHIFTAHTHALMQQDSGWWQDVRSRAFRNAESSRLDVCVCVCRYFHSWIHGISCCVRTFVYQYHVFKKKIFYSTKD